MAFHQLSPFTPVRYTQLWFSRLLPHNLTTSKLSAVWGTQFLQWTPPCNEQCYTEQHYMEVTLHIPDCSWSCAVDTLTFLEPGGAGSKMRVCISEGRAEYTGRMMRSGTSGPSAFILSYRISQAVSISSWPVKNSSTSPETVKSLCLYSFVQVSHTIHLFLIHQKQQDIRPLKQPVTVFIHSYRSHTPSLSSWSMKNNSLSPKTASHSVSIHSYRPHTPSLSSWSIKNSINVWLLLVQLLTVCP